jgi:hypothetical protein
LVCLCLRFPRTVRRKELSNTLSKPHSTRSTHSGSCCNSRAPRGQSRKASRRRWEVLALAIAGLAAFIVPPWAYGPGLFVYQYLHAWLFLPFPVYLFTLSSAGLLLWVAVLAMRTTTGRRLNPLLMIAGASLACVLAAIVSFAASASYAVEWGAWASLGVHILLIANLGTSIFVRARKARKERPSAHPPALGAAATTSSGRRSRKPRERNLRGGSS